MSGRDYITFDPLAAPLEGSHVIEASAGTGKTYNLTLLFLRLVVELDLEVERILVVTFTNMATAELRDEVRRRLRQVLEAIDSGSTRDEQVARYLAGFDPEQTAQARGKIRRALAEYDQAAIFSIHGFCQRMLQRSAFESGVAFDLELQADQRPLCLEIASDFWAREVYSASEPFAEYLERVAKIDRDSLASLAVLASDKPDVEFLYGDCADEEIEPALFAAFEAARAAWQGRCAEARDLLAPLGAGKVLKGPYQGAKLEKLFNAVGDFLAPPKLASLATPKGFANLTPPGLADGVYTAKRKSHAPPEHPVFDALGALSEQLSWTASVYANRSRALKRGLVEFTRRELARRKRERRVQTFSDQLHDLDHALADSSSGDRLAAEIRRRFDAALIDEFQDTNPVQYRIFSRLFDDGSTPLFMVGDPKQSIYAFRGGDIYAYLTAVREAGSAPYTLDVNWRADDRLIRGVSALFSRVDDPFLSAEIGFPPVEPRPGARRNVLEIDGEFPPPLQFLLDGGDEEESEDETAPGADEFARVAANIVGLLGSEAYVIGRGAGPDAERRDRVAERIVPGDIAVLLTANFQAPKLQAALRERGVASVLETDRSVFDTAEAGELTRLLEAIAEPSNAGRVRAALCTDLFGLSADEIWRMQDDDRAWEDWVVRLREWRDAWTGRGLIQMLRSVMALPVGADQLPVQARVLGFPDGERRMTNLLHLAELLHRQSSDAHLGVAGLLRWFAQQRAGGGAAESAELRLESDERAVKLLTVFKAKGLQYPVVYLPFFRRGKVFADGLSEISYHDAALGDSARVDLGSEELEQHRTVAAHEELAERLRVLYVALTRAQHLCRVVWSAFDGMENSALGYLIHRPPDQVEIDEAKAHIRALGPEELASDLETIADRSDGGIGFRRLGDGRCSRRAVGSVPGTIDFECRSPRPEIPAPWISSSYSALVRSSRGHAHEPDSDNDDPRAEQPVPLRDFPAGADPGLFFHKVFEELDFGFDDPAVLRRLVDRWLPRYGLDRQRFATPACDAVTAVLDTPIDPAAELLLRSIPRERRLTELPFVLPVAGGSGAALAPLTPERLATAFRECDGESLAGYAEQLGGLDFGAVRGYLRGTADLVFEHRGRWYVLDYKSNHLGERYGDYARGRLTRPMEDHHYLLQYHLYALAVHRLLRYRLPDYDYDAHFGGAYYLFIRGMSPEYGPAFGVFHDRPRVALIDALDRLFEGGEVCAT